MDQNLIRDPSLNGPRTATGRPVSGKNTARGPPMTARVMDLMMSLLMDLLMDLMVGRPAIG